MSNTYKATTRTGRLPRAQLPPVGPAPAAEPAELAAETVRAPHVETVEDASFDEHEQTTKDRCPACMGKGWLPPDIALGIEDALRQATERQR